MRYSRVSKVTITVTQNVYYADLARSFDTSQVLAVALPPSAMVCPVVLYAAAAFLYSLSLEASAMRAMVRVRPIRASQEIKVAAAPRHSGSPPGLEGGVEAAVQTQRP